MTVSSLLSNSKSQPRYEGISTCARCGGSVLRGPNTFDVRIGRRSVPVAGDFERCAGKCGELYFAPGEMDMVLDRASASIRQAEGLLAPDEIKRFRRGAGLSQAQLESLLGAGPKTVVRWEKGTVIQNGAADTLIRVLRDVPEALDYVRRLKETTSAEEAAAAVVGTTQS